MNQNERPRQTLQNSSRNILPLFLLSIVIIVLFLIGSLYVRQAGILPDSALELNTESASEENSSPSAVTFAVNRNDERTLKYGNIVLDCSVEEFLSNFSYGDIVSVTFPGTNPLIIPVCSSLLDVSAGELLLWADHDEDVVQVCVNCGSLGAFLGFLSQNTENSSFPFSRIESAFPSAATVEMYEQGAYLDVITLGHLEMSNDRDRYPDLSDEEFCNFREIVCGTIGEGRLFRSSSPIDPIIGRNREADQALADHGIRTVVNMTDTEDVAKSFEGFDTTHYSQTNVHYISTGLAYGTEPFNAKIAQCLRVLAYEEGPYLIHCVYGKDRTGFLCSIIESICMADIEDIREDYFKTYEVLYDTPNGGVHIPLSDSVKQLILDRVYENYVLAVGRRFSEEDSFETTCEYVKSIGITDEELEMLRNNLRAQ